MNPMPHGREPSHDSAVTKLLSALRTVAPFRFHIDKERGMSMQHRSVIHRTLRACLAGAAGIGAAGFLSAGAAFAQQDRPLDVPYVPTPQTVVDRMLELG